ncbi:invasion associated locus b family protein [Methylobacterium iners]|uniref:Invasion associated locus b family protein n=1 Tax=Methylobacterium iners TaxID=418707 RepID=A0ABQ4RVM5_9HYPH|nr:invasion associated locus b family protein [Methylobacterium iners]GJD94883.1 hypothetical protein OCOJLMKI_2090 [Methylobacterium iners]
MRSGSRYGLLLGGLILLLCNVAPAKLFGLTSALAQPAAPAEESEAPSKRRRGREKPDAKASVPAPGMQQAKPVDIFGDWNVFAMGQGKTRVCYAIAQPQTRSPKTLKRDTAYLFVTVRKAENVQNEVAVMLGFPAKPASGQGKPGPAGSPGSADPTLNLGNARYGLVVKDGNAWLQNPAEEGRVVAEMGRTAKLTIKAASMRGNPTTDEYALAGFAEAMKRTREECK